MLYFYETSNHLVSHETAVKLGLGYAFETPSIGSVHVNGGPGGKAGVLFSASPESKLIRYKPDLQTWIPYPGKEGLWLGIWKDQRPGPDDLVRNSAKDGHYVKLCDSNEWLIPVARAVDGTSPLPRAMKHDGTQWICGDVESAYRDYFAEACKLWDVMFPQDSDDGDRIVTLGNAADVCAMALGINYKIGIHEVSLLGLLNTENYTAVCRVVVDFPALIELGKKKRAAEAQSSTPGVEA